MIPTDNPPLLLGPTRQASLHSLQDINPKGEEVELTIFWFSGIQGRVARDAPGTLWGQPFYSLCCSFKETRPGMFETWNFFMPPAPFQGMDALAGSPKLSYASSIIIIIIIIVIRLSVIKPAGHKPGQTPREKWGLHPKSSWEPYFGKVSE